jgi:arabinose-5-phosphate isomerase
MNKHSDPIINSALRTFDIHIKGIELLANATANGLGRSIKDAAETIRLAQGRLIVSGIGKSGHIGRKIAATFASTGTPAFFVHATEAGHGDLGMITPKDVILALSWSGETAELSNLIVYSRRFKIPLIALTASPDSTLAKAADIVLALPRAQEACPHNLTPTTSSLMQLALGDAVALALLESRGFTPDDFHVFHPGGQLGAILKHVKDIMHGIADTPLVHQGTRMSEAIVEMSAKGYGCVGIVDSTGNLAGIITDGDLRRHMRPDLLELTVDNVMTRGPKTIGPNQLASEALRIANVSKVQALIVVEQDKPVGIIRLHDILRIGVA